MSTRSIQPDPSGNGNALRELSPREAFYFYVETGAPTGVSARSLQDFLDKLRTVPVKSLEFHTNRGDFENWLRMLGDDKLVKQVSKVKGSGYVGERLRTQLTAVVETRYKDITRAPSTGKR